MITRPSGVFALSALAFVAQPVCAPAVGPSNAIPAPEVVRVAPPTGESADERLQDSVRVLYRHFVAPRYRAVEQAFASAFGSGLRLVSVEARGIGYGYRDAPDLIYPHIRRFLDAVTEHERRRVSTEADTIGVAAPTGEQDADRASTLAALAAVQEGGTVQFAPGTYLIGPVIDVAVPRITSHARWATVTETCPTPSIHTYEAGWTRSGAAAPDLVQRRHGPPGPFAA